VFRATSYRITREGWYYGFVLAFIIAGAILREINLLVVLSGMMVAPLVLSLPLVAGALRTLRVRRRLPQSICAGDLLVVDVETTNEGRGAGTWAILVEDRIHREGSPAAEAISVQVPFAYVPARGARAGGYRGRIDRRGRYRFGPLKITSRFPVGLVSGTIQVDSRETLVVCPRVGRLSPRWREIMAAQQAGSQRSRRRHGLVEGEFFGLRDWRSGDSLRRIHWRTSARRSNPAVRLFEQQSDADLALVLDLWHSPEPRPEELAAVERAVSFAATLAVELCRQGGGGQLIVAAGGDESLVRGGASSLLLQEALEALAVAEASHEDRIPQRLDRVLAEADSGATPIVIGTRPIDLADTSRFAEAWKNPRRRAAMERAVCVSAAGHDLDGYFFAE
jgi:uncharacterized protein (DUF58 family)